ncbi:AMP-binding protein [Simiduia curdlanivorans]|uniref:AMP-binding protein n=1 Tax=Simiduia curdlanivorans TaxID=1492769 RepID=A0ABV8V6V0_9GAMM|nr:AMP-binding protein [Simiduia curdlanivorans]MDN3640804.1 AMP-binding protein [Simiduia curdlanivorans]
MKLFQLLNTVSAAPEYTLAFDRNSVTSSQWLCRVDHWQKHLSAAPELQRLALFIPDSAELAAVLVALWLCGKEAWLAPNNLAETTQHLSQRVDGFIGDFSGVSTLSLAAQVEAEAEVSTIVTPLASDAVLVLFTSGSSGEPQLIRKSLRQLAAEVEQLEQCFGAALADCRIYATVSHQHIYGLLFRILWPLACRRPFARFTTEYVERIFTQRATPLCLVSSPTHLSRLPVSIDHQHRVNQVFSSGGPLSAAASASAHEQLQADIVEVYGSTETGGIAWRRQHQGDAAWCLFEVVQAKVNAQQCLAVKSPFLPDDDWFESSDIVAMQGDTFCLIGRADRVAKVEGKRVSLEQIEAFLLADSWIDDVRVEPVVRAGALASRDELMALVVLSPEGVAALASEGRQTLAKHFKRILGQLLERPLVPRRWRYIDRLPRNPQGKIQYQQLQLLVKQLQQATE